MEKSPFSPLFVLKQAEEEDHIAVKEDENNDNAENLIEANDLSNEQINNEQLTVNTEIPSDKVS